ncbi:MAG: alanine--tRNA ligase [Candidatus Doudnabacteria bacterium]|nr:alanine--tRNA ligase [Candidatus Doudnabacteria bacterium]
MTAKELRRKYLQFFKDRGHTVIPSASLVPENDPTVLFTTAGMHPLVPYLLGQEHPGGKRLVSVQKSLRTDDIDEVGDEVHNTFFEMLGNWSLGDYWKKEAIEWSFEFLTNKKWLGINPKNLAVSVFAGDSDAPRDEESAQIWKSLDIPSRRIAYLPKKDNWWGPAGIAGPCGPDTEMFYWIGKGEAPEKFDPSDSRWVEIWNDVFMQYNKTIEGKYEPLKQKNVDTGMGLERTLAVLQGKESVYETELFAPIIKKIEGMAPTPSSSPPQAGGEKPVRIIADHLRAATFIMADGIAPSNKDRGYILRRLIRRAVTHGRKLGIKQEFSTEIAAVVIEEYQSVYPELKRHAERIIDELGKEDLRFRKTLDRGLKEFEKLKKISGKDAFDLFQTYGFPLELTEELARNQGIKINKSEFEAEFKKHQELSRTSSAGVFKGGLADHSEKTTRLHTATHLLQAGLRHVLGKHLFQKGSHVTAERTRFDFNHRQKVSPEELKRIEDWVNEQVRRDLKVKREVMTVSQARQLGAIGLFDEKYEDKVSIYTIWDPATHEVVSREFCGGPHVEHTGQIGKFKIVKEEAVAAGIRRIKAVVE